MKEYVRETGLRVSEYSYCQPRNKSVPIGDFAIFLELEPVIGLTSHHGVKLNNSNTSRHIDIDDDDDDEGDDDDDVDGNGMMGDLSEDYNASLSSRLSAAAASAVESATTNPFTEPFPNEEEQEDYI